MIKLVPSEVCKIPEGKRWSFTPSFILLIALCLYSLTALEVAKPQFRVAFSTERCTKSSLSMRTIRPSMSLNNLSSLYEPRTSMESACDYPPLLPPPIDFDVTYSSENLLNNLRYVSSELCHYIQPVQLDEIKDILYETRKTSRDILSHFRAQLEDARKELEDARTTFSRVDSFWSSVSHAAESTLQGGVETDGLLFELTHVRKLTRDSADSQATAVSDLDARVTSKAVSPSLQSGLFHGSDTYINVAEYRDAAVATDAPVLNVFVPQATRTIWPEWLDNFIPYPETVSQKDQLGSFYVDHGHDGDHTHLSVPSQKELKRPTSPRRDAIKSIWAGRKKEEAVVLDDEKRNPLDATAKNGAGHGSSRFKTWLKKKIIPDHRSMKLEIVWDIDDGCAVGRDVKGMGAAECDHPYERDIRKQIDGREGDMTLIPIPMDPASRAHLIALVSCSRDLGNIEEGLTAVRSIDFQNMR